MHNNTTKGRYETTELQQQLQAMYANNSVDWLHLIAEQERQQEEQQEIRLREEEKERKQAIFWCVFILCIAAAAALIGYIHLHV